MPLTPVPLKPIHLRGGPAGAGEYYPTLCGLSPVARQPTTVELEHVTCAACFGKYQVERVKPKGRR